LHNQAALGLGVTGTDDQVDEKLTICADEVIGILKRSFSDPVLAWAMLQTAVSRRIEDLRESEAAPLADPGCSRGRAEEPTSVPLELPWPTYAEITSMTLQAEALAPAEPPAGERPFVGYDRERAVYARLKPELIASAEGKFLVLVGEEFEGPIDTFEEALRIGWRRFGLGPLYVKQILAKEPETNTVCDQSCPS
jgi:hypothetical protein